MATYYVKTGGNNVLDGLSPANAWATIAKVNSFAFSSGDIVQFNGGDTFNDAMLVCDNTNVTYTNYGTGYPIVGLASAGNPAIDVTATNVTLSNLIVDQGRTTTVTDATSTGFYGVTVESGANDCTLTNVEIRNCDGAGVTIQGTATLRFTMTGGSIHNIGINGILFNNQTTGGSHVIDGVRIYTTGQNTTGAARHGVYAKCCAYTIKNCELYDNANGQALSVRSTVNTGNTTNTYVYKNYIHDTNIGIYLLSDLTTTTGTIRVFQNRLINITTDPIYVGNATTTRYDQVIANNTIVGNHTGYGISVGDQTDNNSYVYNNVVSGGSYAFFGNSGRTTGSCFEDYNCWYNQSQASPFRWNAGFSGFATYKTNSSQSAHSITSDPTLGSSPTYYLNSGSPCVNAGTSSVTGLTYATSGSPDILYYASAPDMGATESGSGGTVMWLRG